MLDSLPRKYRTIASVSIWPEALIGRDRASVLCHGLVEAARRCATKCGALLCDQQPRGAAADFFRACVRIYLEYVNIDRLADRHHMEFWLVTLLRICRAITNTRLAPKQIKLRHFRSETPPDVRSHLGCEIDFAADNDEILFPASIGTLPVVGADVHLNTLLLQYANEALRNRAHGVPAPVLASKTRSLSCSRRQSQRVGNCPAPS